MPSELILAIDVGSQSAKVALVDPGTGELVDRAVQPLRSLARPAPGQVVHPDDDLWDSLTAAIRELLGRNEDRVIMAVGLCAARYCRAHLDERGRLVEPILNWMDARVREPLASGVFGVSSSGGYLAWRLTGRFADTAGDYTGFWPLDRATGSWSSADVVRQRYGMQGVRLPELVPPAGLLGKVSADGAMATGIPSGVAVYATSNDKAVEALGAGLRRPEQSLISLGTYVAAMTPLTDRTRFTSDDYWVNDAAVAGEYLAESRGVRRGMWTVSWFRDLIGLPAGVGEAQLEAEARSVPPGCDGLMAIPDWLATPEAPHRRGALIGFDGSHGRAQIHRAILEGIGRRMADHLTAMEQALGRRTSEVRLSGGGARSPLFAQLFAALLNRPVRVATVSDAALLGAAVCAAVGAGRYPDADAAVLAMVRVEEPVTAPPEQVATYLSWMARHRGVDQRLDELCRSLNS